MELLLPWRERQETKVWNHELLSSSSPLRQQIVLLPINSWATFAPSAWPQMMRWAWQLLLPNLFSFLFLSGISYAKFDWSYTVVVQRGCGMEVGEEQKGAAVMGSGLCVEMQAAIASDRGNERWIKRFLGEKRRDGSEECALLAYHHLLGDFCERQLHVKEGRQITHSEIIAERFISCYSNFVILAFALNYLMAAKQYPERAEGGKMQGQPWQ